MMNYMNYPEIDYGPLTKLIGTWTGDRGIDIAPEPDSTEENPYYETITYEDVGDLHNAEEQHIAMVRYLQVVRRKSNDGVFHDQTGYWMWEVGTNNIMHSLVIPRGLGLVAGGQVQDSWKTDDEMKFTVAVDDGTNNYLISQSPFLKNKAETTAYSATFTISDSQLSYEQCTDLQIYGREFAHTDSNSLIRA